MKRLCLVAAIMFAASLAQAAPITSFENLDFDAGVAHFPTGFDAPGADVPGWVNGGPIVDSGVEGQEAWWGPYEDFAAFMAAGDSAYNLSSYTIQAGDVFNVSWYSQHWNWEGPAAWTATLFYDDPANVIGSFTQSPLPNHTEWALFTSPSIAATPASVGGTLGILLSNTGAAGTHAQVDEIVVNLVPEPATIGMVGVCGAFLVTLRRRAAR